MGQMAHSCWAWAQALVQALAQAFSPYFEVAVVVAEPCSPSSAASGKAWSAGDT